MYPYQIKAVQQSAALANYRRATEPKPAELEPSTPAVQPWPEGQLTRADLDGMSPADIVSAKREGRLDALLGRMDGVSE